MAAAGRGSRLSTLYTTLPRARRVSLGLHAQSWRAPRRHRGRYLRRLPREAPRVPPRARDAAEEPSSHSFETLLTERDTL